MPVPTFSLFKPAIEDPPEDLIRGVSDLLDLEVRRAALKGADPDAITRNPLTVDMDEHTVAALGALARATGSSRRAMGSKILNAAVWEAVNELHRLGNHEELPEYEAVLAEWTDAYNELWGGRQK